VLTRLAAVLPDFFWKSKMGIRLKDFSALYLYLHPDEFTVILF